MDKEERDSGLDNKKNNKDSGLVSKSNIEDSGLNNDIKTDSGLNDIKNKTPDIKMSDIKVRKYSGASERVPHLCPGGP